MTFHPVVVLGLEHEFLFKSAATYCVARGTKYEIFGVPDCILRYAYIIWSFLWPLLTAKAKIIEHTLLVRECVNIYIAPKQTRKKKNSVHTS